jgi:hypothetical protein
LYYLVLPPLIINVTSRPFGAFLVQKKKRWRWSREDLIGRSATATTIVEKKNIV